MEQIKDVSSFFVWEDSADSEVDINQLESAVDDQEDACSCSCDDNYSTDFQAVDLIRDGQPDQLDGRRWSGAELVYNSEEEEEEEEESSNNIGVIRDMNAMEDRVFWDTCMAGGYP